MDEKTLFFNRLRPRLQAIAYRMLGTVADAEELVQDVWLRWHEAEQNELDNAEAWLVTVTTRLAIDRLRTAKVQRARYTGFWLPEPQLTPFITPDDSTASPEQVLDAPTTFPWPSSPWWSGWPPRHARPSCCAKSSTPTTPKWRAL